MLPLAMSRDGLHGVLYILAFVAGVLTHDWFKWAIRRKKK